MLPSCIYGAVLATFLRVGVLNAPQSAGSRVFRFRVYNLYNFSLALVLSTRERRTIAFR